MTNTQIADELAAELNASTSSWEMLKESLEWLVKKDGNMPPQCTVRLWADNQLALVDTRLQYGEEVLSRYRSLPPVSDDVVECQND